MILHLLHLSFRTMIFLEQFQLGARLGGTADHPHPRTETHSLHVSCLPGAPVDRATWREMMSSGRFQVTR